ncbi:MAG: diaminopimelate epimerase [Planctomycetes bacterium]|nr:diaminopimelate epimerase [Planctomycetota bacterium]
MQFAKMHGLRNDYIYIDTFRERVPNPARLARAVSDRHSGIGSDGLILVGAADEGAAADLRMRIFNADGSESQMCGNGIRCVAKFAVERGLAERNPLRIQTGRGTLAVSWRGDPRGGVSEATVDMGEPILELSKIPAKLAGVSPTARAIAVTLPPAWWAFDANPQWMTASGCDGKLTLVSMGNPHAILWCRDVASVPLERIGPAIENHPSFPERINVHVAQCEGRSHVRVRTWERGSGITQACGTGACAVVVAGVLEGKLSGPCEVILPGGSLTVEWPGADHGVSMTGPAIEVCRGTLSNELQEKAN